MNAPAAIALDPVAAFMPWEEPGKRALRRRILRCQQRAATRACQCESGRAKTQWWIIVALAAERAFAPASEEALRDLLALIARLALCADGLERLDSE